MLIVLKSKTHRCDSLHGHASSVAGDLSGWDVCLISHDHVLLNIVCKKYVTVCRWGNHIGVDAHSMGQLEPIYSISRSNISFISRGTHEHLLEYLHVHISYLTHFAGTQTTLPHQPQDVTNYFGNRLTKVEKALFRI
jgi:hypothetical protein